MKDAATALQEAGASISEIVGAVVAYFGPLDDPRVGWCHHKASQPHLFRCERCDAEHEHSSEINHRPYCPVPRLLNVLAALKKYAETP